MGFLSSALNTAVRKTGFELRRRQDTLAELAAYPRTASAGWIMEIIGLEGIGKTTLVNALAGHLRKTWFLRLNLGQLGPAPQSDGELEQLHRTIYFAAAESLKQKNGDAWEAITRLRQKGRVISESLTLLTHDFPRGFVLDEGLFKGFPKEILDLDEVRSEPLWRGRAFVYVRPGSPNVAVSRYQLRSAERNARGLPMALQADEHVRDSVEKHTGRYDRMVERAAAFGCPTLILQAEDALAKNVEKVLAFERNLLTGSRPCPQRVSPASSSAARRGPSPNGRGGASPSS